MHHRLANYTVQGRAVGLTTGTEYILHETHNMNGGAGFHFTMSFIATAVTPGVGSNELWQCDSRYRVDESGAIVMDEFLFECMSAADTSPSAVTRRSAESRAISAWTIAGS